MTDLCRKLNDRVFKEVGEEVMFRGKIYPLLN